MNFSSKLIERAVDGFSSLPGVGKKSALRYVLHLLKQDEDATKEIAEAILELKANIKECDKCHNISDTKTCSICTNALRKKHTLCVVETIRDVMAIEETGQFRGRYHVLGGVISPLDGVGPGELNIDSLIDRIAKENIKELIMAVSPTIDGDTTIYYISKKITDPTVNVSTLARGISFGGELEYADEVTLGRSIVGRIPYSNNDKK